MRGCSFAENFVTEDRILINNGVTTGSGVTVERSITFDGTQHVDYDIVSQALPATAVIRFSAQETSEGILLANANLISGTPADGFCVWTDADGVKATYSDGAAIETALEIDIDYTTGHVFTVTYVFAATAHTLYVDSETPDTASTTTAGPIGETTAVMVGGDGSDNFIGTIYRTRIFNNALTAGEHALYENDTLTSFVEDAFATYGCDTFGNDTDGNRIWDNTNSVRDLTKGDGSTSSLFPTFVDYPSHYTQYYSFDGVDDYLSDWPTMPSTYTVSAALSSAYPTGIPYIQQVNDDTIETLLTTGGALAGNLHCLTIFDGVLEQIQLYHLEWTQLSRLWRETSCDAYTSRLIIEGTCVQSYFFENPAQTLNDYSDVNTTQTDTDITWDNGVEFASSTSEISVPDEADLRSDEITIHAVVEGLTSSTDDYLVIKGVNYTLRKVSNVLYFLTSTLSLPPPVWGNYSAITVTCKSGENPKFYFDGVYNNDGSTTVTVDHTETDDLYIGNDSDGSNNFKGKIRKLSVYKQVLTPSEIKTLYEHTRPADDYESEISITDVDTDDSITSTQTDVVLTGVNMGASAGKVYLANNSTLGFASIVVEQDLDSWSSTSIQFDVVPGTLLD